MPVSLSLLFLPSASDVPPDVNLKTLLAEVSRDHVAAPSSVDVGPLRRVVQHAKADGIDLSIVVMAANPPSHGDLRDVATAIGRHEQGTVLVLSPDDAGTFSHTFTRVRLEGAEDLAKTQHGQPVAAAGLFVDKLAKDPTVPWTAVSSVVLVGVVAVVGALYWIKARRSRVLR